MSVKYHASNDNFQVSAVDQPNPLISVSYQLPRFDRYRICLWLTYFCTDPSYFSAATDSFYGKLPVLRRKINYPKENGTSGTILFKLVFITSCERLWDRLLESVWFGSSLGHSKESPESCTGRAMERFPYGFIKQGPHTHTRLKSIIDRTHKTLSSSVSIISRIFAASRQFPYLHAYVSLLALQVTSFWKKLLRFTSQSLYSCIFSNWTDLLPILPMHIDSGGVSYRPICICRVSKLFANCGVLSD